MSCALARAGQGQLRAGAHRVCQRRQRRSQRQRRISDWRDRRDGTGAGRVGCGACSNGIRIRIRGRECSASCCCTHANGARRSLPGARSIGRCAEAVRYGRIARSAVRRCACPARSGSRVGESSDGRRSGLSHGLAATTGQPGERVSGASIGGNRKWCVGRCGDEGAFERGRSWIDTWRQTGRRVCGCEAAGRGVGRSTDTAACRIQRCRRTLDAGQIRGCDCFAESVCASISGRGSRRAFAPGIGGNAHGIKRCSWCPHRFGRGHTSFSEVGSVALEAGTPPTRTRRRRRRAALVSDSCGVAVGRGSRAPLHVHRPDSAQPARTRGRIGCVFAQGRSDAERCCCPSGSGRCLPRAGSSRRRPCGIPDRIAARSDEREGIGYCSADTRCGRP